MTPEDAAIEYIARGWSVFPVGGDKRPLIGQWGHLQDRHPTDSEVRAWYSRWQHAGLAVVTGRISGLVVLDVDVQHGGDKTLAGLLKSKVLLKGDLETAHVKTQSGGTHYYFRYPVDDTDIRVPSARGVWEGIDVRADGGYVVAPPTLGETGNTYTWLNDPDISGLQDVPDKLLELLLKKAAKSRLTDEQKSELLKPQAEGGRHEALMRLTGHFAAKGEERATTWAILSMWNDKNTPPIPEVEFQRQFDDMWSRWAPDEKEVSLDETLARVREAEDTDHKTLLMNVLEGRKLSKTEHAKYRETVHDEFNFPKGLFDTLVTKVKTGKQLAADEDDEFAPVEVTGERKEAAIELLKEPDLLYRCLEQVRKHGLIGEEANMLLCYLSASSRYLEDPINIRLQGESSSGKSAVMLKTLELIPPEEKIVKHGFSPQAVIYSPLVFKHKVVCLLELAGGERAGFNIRVLQSEHRIEFDVVTKEGDGQGFTTKTYAKEGPAAWMTSTVNITDDVQNMSRTWPITPDSSPEQTWLVAESQTKRRAAVPEEEVELFWDIQRLMAGGRVGVAYPTDIHEVILDYIKGQNPKIDTTFRRDNERIREVIRASAFVHQYQRALDDDGMIQPDIRDYYFAWSAARTALTHSVASLVSEPKFRDVCFVVSDIYSKRGGEAVSNAEILEGLRERGWSNSAKTMDNWVRAVSEKGGIMRVRQGFWQPIVLVTEPFIESPELMPDPGYVLDQLKDKHPEWVGMVSYDPLDGVKLTLN